MIPRYPMMPACLLVLLLFLTGLRVGAEPLYPLLSPAAADSLRTLLRQDKPDTNRVSQLIRLGEYQVYKPGEFTADMDSARTYSVVIQSVNNNYSLTLCELA